MFSTQNIHCKSKYRPQSRIICVFPRLGIDDNPVEDNKCAASQLLGRGLNRERDINGLPCLHVC